MGKLRKILRDWIDGVIERSFQRQANKIFAKHDVVYRDGDNT